MRTKPTPENSMVVNPTTEKFNCGCGGWFQCVEVDDRSGVLHSHPPCDELVDMDQVSYLRLQRLRLTHIPNTHLN